MDELRLKDLTLLRKSSRVKWNNYRIIRHNMRKKKKNLPYPSTRRKGWVISALPEELSAGQWRTVRERWGSLVLICAWHAGENVWSIHLREYLQHYMPLIYNDNLYKFCIFTVLFIHIPSSNEMCGCVVPSITAHWSILCQFQLQEKPYEICSFAD